MSGAGSLVLFSIGVTNLDSIKYDLLFERMLNPERPGFPDIDVDFDYYRKDEVLEYLRNKYGDENVAQIGTYTSLSSKIVLKDVGRILGIDHNEINDLNKELPSSNGKVMNLADAVIELPAIIKAKEKYPQLFELALEVQSMPRGAGVHACFDADTSISTSSGLKKISDIEVGDFVLTHNNRYKPVVDLMVNDSSDIYHVRTSSSHPLRVTGNHPFLTREMNYKLVKNKTKKGYSQVKTYSNPIWKPVSDLKVGFDYLGIAINQNSIIPNHKGIQLPFEDENFWWLMGRYIGDGWIESCDRVYKNGHSPRTETRVIICCTKINDIEKTEIVERLENLGFDYRVETSRTTYKIFIKKEGLFDYLQSFGKYAHGKKINKDVFHLPEHLGNQFLNGYVSADGHYYEKEDKMSIRTVSKELAIGTMQLINKFLKRPVSLQFAKAKTETIEGRVVNSRKKYTISYTLSQRKMSRSFYEDGYIWTRLSVLEKEESLPLPMYNLTVLDDSSYVVNGLIAHNCGVQVSNTPLRETIPLMRSKDGDSVTQYEGGPLEDLGFIKFDILSLKNLSVMRIAADLVKSRHGIDIDINNLEPESEKAFEMIRNGNTQGIFQLEYPYIGRLH